VRDFQIPSLTFSEILTAGIFSGAWNFPADMAL
jgi:hypothetical protein